MANKLYEESDIQAIATAIRGKNGSSDTYKVSQMATAIANIPTGGSITVNNGEIVEKYAYDDNVSANNFIQLINSLFISNITNTNDAGFNVIKISDNKLFLTYGHTNDLYAAILNIDYDNEIFSVGTAVKLNGVSDRRSYSYPVSVLLDTNKILIVVSSGSTSYASNYFYGFLVDVTNDIITTGTPVELKRGGYNLATSGYLKICKIDSTSAFLIYTNDSNYNLYGSIVTVVNNTITMGTETQLDNQQYSGQYLKMCSVNTDKFLILHRSGSTSHLYGLVASTENDVITVGTNTQISETASSSTYTYNSCDKYDTNKALVLYAYSRIRALFITVSNLTITVGTYTQLTTTTYYNYFTVAYMGNNKFLVEWSGNGFGNIYYECVTISNDVFTAHGEIQLDYLSVAQGTVFVQLNSNSAVIIQRGNKVSVRNITPTPSSYHSYKCGTVMKINSDNSVDIMQKIIEADTQIDGLSIENATTSTKGDIYILDN